MTTPSTRPSARRVQRTARLHEALPLYGITRPDPEPPRRTLEDVHRALEAGLRILQLRKPHASDTELFGLAASLRALTRRFDAILFINNRLDVALVCDADGVHLGADDLPVADARVRAPDLLIGATCRTPADALRAAQDDADLIGLGPIFDARATKPDAAPARGTALVRDTVHALATAHAAGRIAHLPRVVAIGGLDPANAPDCLRDGADGVAVVRALFDDATDPAARVRTLRAALQPRAPSQRP